jgi:hypothetical protein
MLGYRRTRIHNFTNSKLITSPHAEASPSAITALTQSPAIDVVGIGFTTGEISVYDVRADERLMRMFMEGGAVRALSFRNGGYHPFQAATMRFFCCSCSCIALQMGSPSSLRLRLRVILLYGTSMRAVVSYMYCGAHTIVQSLQ